MIIDDKEVCMIPGEASTISEEEHIERYKFASDFVKSKRVLDIACGVGYGSYILSKAGAHSVIGCDIMKSNIEYANAHYSDEKTSFLVKDAKVPIDEGEFDVVVSFETIEHVDDCYSVLSNLKNSLSENGMLIISSPNRKITNPYLRVTDRPSFEYHFREYTRDEFYLLVESYGFSNIQEYGQRWQYYFNSPFFEKHYKRLFKPSRKSSPLVTKCSKDREPEYFIFTARK